MTQKVPDLTFTGLLILTLKYRKFLSVLSVLTIILSSLVSMILPEYYQSTAIIFPARTNSLYLHESNVRRGNISDFGEEEEAEQILQIIQSEALKMRVIEKNNLYSHYKIDTLEKYALSKIRQKYRSNVNVKRTKYNSIDITVTDLSKEMAADIANSIAEFTDSVKNQMIRERARTSLDMLDRENDRLTDSLTELNQKIDSLQALGVSGELERSSVYEAYGKALSNGNSPAAGELKKQIELNKKFADEFDRLRRQRENLIDQVMRFKTYRNQFYADAAINIPQKFIVDRAIPADKKSYPIRWMIVVGSLFSVLLFSLFLLIVKENKEWFRMVSKTN